MLKEARDINSKADYYGQSGFIEEAIKKLSGYAQRLISMPCSERRQGALDTVACYLSMLKQEK